MTDKRAAIVLAAGKGKRMKSDLPKVLHEINGQPIIKILLDTLVSLNFDRIVVVVGYKGEMVQRAIADYPATVVWQRKQLGTGHAVMMAEEAMKGFDGTTLIALGDVPFLSASSIEKLMDTHRESAAKATCLSAILDDPTGYGRIVREPGTDILKSIVEHKDAPEEVRKINEINSGTFCYDNLALFETLKAIGNDNSQAEYYLTDTIKLLHDKGLRVSVVASENPDELRGVNSAEQLSQLGEIFADRF
ncbi:MAG: NTP transferase domain-containing protein [bacterium]|nr:NTP transferase domain-containing protein [bacterium]